MESIITLDMDRNEKWYKKWWAILIWIILGLIFFSFTISGQQKQTDSPEVKGEREEEEIEQPSPESSPTTTPEDTPGESPETQQSQDSLGVSREKAKVVKVIDGDTIKLEDGRAVRYIGIDTPETVHPSKPVQCYGKEASDKNRELVEEKEMKKDSQIKGLILKNFVWVLIIGFFLGFFTGQFWLKRHTWVGVYYPNSDNLDSYQLSPPLYSLDECRKWVNSRVRGNTNYDYECGRGCRFKTEYGGVIGPMICKETVR